jgi:hypothetical protein
MKPSVKALPLRLLGPLLALLVGLSLPQAARAKGCNIVVNPGFEAGTDGWSWRNDGPFWHGFTPSSERAHSGKRSALTPLQPGPVVSRAQIWGAVQPFKLSKLPRKLNLWFRVEDWSQAVAKQYVQVVVMLHDARFHRLTTQAQMQLRYILTGLSETPYDPVNGRYLMAGPALPKQGKWIHFRADLVEDFIRAWGWYPENFQKMEIFLEARYDEPLPENSMVSGKVFWDDVEICP